MAVTHPSHGTLWLVLLSLWTILVYFGVVCGQAVLIQGNIFPQLLPAPTTSEEASDSFRERSFPLSDDQSFLDRGPLFDSIPLFLHSPYYNAQLSHELSPISDVNSQVPYEQIDSSVVRTPPQQRKTRAYLRREEVNSELAPAYFNTATPTPSFSFISSSYDMITTSSLIAEIPTTSRFTPSSLATSSSYFGMFFTLSPCYYHFTRSKYERCSLWFTNSHNNSSKTLN